MAEPVFKLGDRESLNSGSRTCHGRRIGQAKTYAPPYEKRPEHEDYYFAHTIGKHPPILRRYQQQA